MKALILALALIGGTAHAFQFDNSAKIAADLAESEELIRSIYQDGQTPRVPGEAFRAVDTRNAGVYGVRIGQDSQTAAAALAKHLGPDPKVGYGFPVIGPDGPKKTVWSIYRHVSAAGTVTLNLRPQGSRYIVTSILFELSRGDAIQLAVKSSLGEPTAASNGIAFWCASPQSVIKGVVMDGRNNPCMNNERGAVAYGTTLRIF